MRSTRSISVEGAATRVSPQRSMTTWVTAVVSGSTSWKRAPAPALVEISMRPPIATSSERTTSMPTPRPARPVTSVTVEKPGAQISWASCASSARASAASRPSARPRSRMRARSRPAPSSLNSTATSLPSWRSLTVIWPVASLPRAARSAGGSMPWTTQLRSRCSKAGVMRSSTPRSISIEPPTTSSRTCLPVSLAAWRTTR